MTASYSLIDPQHLLQVSEQFPELKSMTSSGVVVDSKKVKTADQDACDMDVPGVRVYPVSSPVAERRASWPQPETAHQVLIRSPAHISVSGAAGLGYPVQLLQSVNLQRGQPIFLNPAAVQRSSIGTAHCCRPKLSGLANAVMICSQQCSLHSLPAVPSCERVQPTLPVVLTSMQQHVPVRPSPEDLDPAVPHPRYLRKRTTLSEQTTALLRRWLEENVDRPFPSYKEKVKLAQEAGISLLQLSNWLVNSRRRILPRLRQQQHQQQGQKPAVDAPKQLD